MAPIERAEKSGEALKTTVTIGTSGAGSATYLYPNMLNKVIGTKFRIVSGYQGNAEAFIAMERGEIDAVSTGWFTIKSTKRAWLEGNSVNILVQYLPQRHRDLANVPALVELAQSPQDKRLLQLFASEGEIGKSIFLPPDVPPGTLTILNGPSDSMALDPTFVADADNLQAEHDFIPGERLQRLVEAVAELQLMS